MKSSNILSVWPLEAIRGTYTLADKILSKFNREWTEFNYLLIWYVMIIMYHIVLSDLGLTRFLFLNKLTRPCSKLDFLPSVGSHSCFQLCYPQHPQSVNCVYRQWSASEPAEYGNCSVDLNMLRSAYKLQSFSSLFFLVKLVKVVLRKLKMATSK